MVGDIQPSALDGGARARGAPTIHRSAQIRIFDAGVLTTTSLPKLATTHYNRRLGVPWLPPWLPRGWVSPGSSAAYGLRGK
jgi:hypothetical protein